MSDKARIIAYNKPIGGEPMECFVDPGQTISDLFPELSGQVDVAVNGKPLQPAYYDCQTIAAGDLVTIVRMPAGDTDDRKAIGRTALIVSLQIAAAVATQGASVAWQIGASAAATVGGSLVANQVGLVPSPDLNASGETTQFKKRGALTGSRNRLSPYSPVPRVYGHMRMFPPMAAKPYTEIVGNQQYLRLLFNLGEGPLELSNPKIGDTLIGSFDSNNQFTSNDAYEDVRIEVGEDPYLYSRDINEEQPGDVFTDFGDQGIQTTVADCDEVSVDLTFGRGLFGVDENDLINSSVTFELDYRDAGSSDAWTPHTNGANIRYIRCSESGGAISITSDAKETYRAGISFRFPTPGQYEVRLRRTSQLGNQDPNEGPVHQQESNWSAFRSIKYENPTDLPGTVQIAMRIKATDQLNGILDEFNVEAKSRLSYYDGSDWQHPTFNASNGSGTGGIITSNPAWILADLFCGDSNQQAVGYDKLDADAFKYWADNLGIDFQYNSVIDSTSTVHQLANNIAAAGRASWGVQDGVYRPILDEAGQDPVQMFTPRNSSDFSASKTFPEELHGLKMKFRNAANGWKEDEAIVYQDGYSADGTNCRFDDGTGVCKQATKFTEVQLDGVTSWDQAWRLGRYKLAERLLRPETFKYRADVENLRCQRGDVVFMSSDVTLWGSTWGRLKAVTRNGSNEVTELELDQPVPMVSGNNYNIRIRQDDGSFSVLSVATVEGSSNTITIDIPQVAAIGKGDLFTFGEDGEEAVPLKIIDIKPGPDLTATLTLVDRADEIHDADTGTIPPYDSNITEPIEFDDTRPPAPMIDNVRSDDSSLYKDDDGTFRLRMLVSFSVAQGNQTTEIEARYRAVGSDGGWVGLFKADANLGVVALPDVQRGKDYVIQIRSRYKNNVSGWVQYGSDHTVEGKQQSPSDLTTYSVFVDKAVLRHRWNDPTDTDIEKFEIRQGADWATGIFVDRTKGTTITSDIPGDGVYTYWVKAIDTHGNYSGIAISDSVTIDPKYNSDPIYDGEGYVKENTTPVFNQVVLNNPPASDQQAIRGGQLLQTTAPITGGDKLRNGPNVGLAYNPANLVTPGSQLDTIQDIHTSADVTFNSLFLKTDLELHDDNGGVTTQTFAGGFGGSGARLVKVNGYHELTVDDLVVRRLARFYEIVVEKVRANGGTIVVSPGAEKIIDSAQTGDSTWDFNATGFNPFAGDSPSGSVEYTFADQYECFIEEDKYITIDDDDLVWRQQWNGRGTGVTQGVVIATETGSATETDNTPARSFTVAITNASEVPSAGMDFAVIGNMSDPARQSGIIISASDTGNPYRRIYTGVDRLDKFGDTSTIKGQDGRLDNLSVPEFSDLDGSQQNLFGAYWDGNFYVNDGHFRGIVEVTGGNAATDEDLDQNLQDAKDYTDQKVTSQAGNVIMRQDSEPTSRPDGSPRQVGDMWIETDNNDKPFTWDGSAWVEAYSVITGDSISTPNLATISANMGQLTVDETITVGDGTGSGVIESQNYDASNGFLLRASDGKLIANNAEIRGEINAETGTLDTLTMNSGGSIELPPSFGGGNNGRITRSGIDMVYDGSQSQEISWYGGLGSDVLRLSANNNGGQVGSDYDLNVYAGGSHNVNLGSNPGNEVHFQSDAYLDENRKFSMNATPYSGDPNSFAEGLFQIAAGNLPGLLSLGAQTTTISGGTLTLDRGLSGGVGEFYTSFLRVTNSVNQNLDTITWKSGDEPSFGAIVCIWYPNAILTVTNNGNITRDSTSNINANRVGVFMYVNTNKWILLNHASL